MGEPKMDKLAKVREAGEAIRTALAENMRARIGDVVEEEVLVETETTLAAVLKLYLEQIIPELEVSGFAKVLPSLDNPETIEFVLSIRGRLVVSISPGAEDDTLPDPEPVVEVEVPTTSTEVGTGRPRKILMAEGNGMPKSGEPPKA